MNETASDWVKKAETDYGVMLREAQIMEAPDPICFHAQQCIEKYAKGYLLSQNVEFARTHNMEYLWELCAAQDASFNQHRAGFKTLDDYSVEIRYPGEDAVATEAHEAVEITKRLRAFIRHKLGLD